MWYCLQISGQACWEQKKRQWKKPNIYMKWKSGSSETQEKITTQRFMIIIYLFFNLWSASDMNLRHSPFLLALFLFVTDLPYTSKLCFFFYLWLNVLQKQKVKPFRAYLENLHITSIYKSKPVYESKFVNIIWNW